MHIAVSRDFRPARAKAIISGEKLIGITILDGGLGYKTEPTVIIGGGGAASYANGIRATATATIDSKTGAVTNVKISDGGSRCQVEPEVIFVSNDEGVQKGMVLPRVNLNSVLDTKASINIPDRDNSGDGLLVYREGRGVDGVPTWYDKIGDASNGDRWYEAANAFKTPKIALFTFRKNRTNFGINTAGKSGNLEVDMYQESISNLQGVTRFNNDATVKLPKIAATYMVEVTLNLITNKDTNTPSKNLAYGNNCHPTTGNCSAPITTDGYQFMGYFGQLELKNATSLSMADQTRMFSRKEDAVITRIGEKHSITFLYTVTLTASSFNDQEPYLNFRLGRMLGSSYYLPVDVLAEGSFIKVQKID